MNTKITELTRGEEEIMQILWRLGDAVVNDIIARTDEPHPKYTTVATFLKILENKGFVSHTAEGKSHRYFPLIGREEYARGVMSSMLSSYFDGSLAQLVSFFSRHENIPAREMDEILEIMHNAKNNRRENPRHLRPRSAGLQRRAAGGLRHPAPNGTCGSAGAGPTCSHRPSWRRSFRCCASPSGRAR